MSQDKIDKIFKYIDLVRWILYGLIMGAVGIAVWATTMQFKVQDLRSDLDAMTGNIQHNRDLHAEHDKQEEHRFTKLEQALSDHGWKLMP
jgi:hypothetical protein